MGVAGHNSKVLLLRRKKGMRGGNGGERDFDVVN